MYVDEEKVYRCACGLAMISDESPFASPGSILCPERARGRRGHDSWITDPVPFLVRWGQSGRAIVEAHDANEAFDIGNAWLEENVPLCAIHEAWHATDAELRDGNLRRIERSET